MIELIDIWLQLQEVSLWEEVRISWSWYLHWSGRQFNHLLNLLLAWINIQPLLRLKICTLRENKYFKIIWFGILLNRFHQTLIIWETLTYYVGLTFEQFTSFGKQYRNDLHSFWLCRCSSHIKYPLFFSSFTQQINPLPPGCLASSTWSSITSSQRWAASPPFFITFEADSKPRLNRMRYLYSVVIRFCSPTKGLIVLPLLIANLAMHFYETIWRVKGAKNLTCHPNWFGGCFFGAILCDH